MSKSMQLAEDLGQLEQPSQGCCAGCSIKYTEYTHIYIYYICICASQTISDENRMRVEKSSELCFACTSCSSSSSSLLL